MISRIIERGLVKDGRLVRLRGACCATGPARSRGSPGWWPRTRANIAPHRPRARVRPGAGIGETEVELTLETSGREQIELVKRA